MNTNSTDMLNIIFIITDKATAPLKKVEKSFDKIAMANRKLGNDLLSLGLGFLFAGMSIQKFFGSLASSSLNTFRQIIDVHNEFFQKTQQLTASWEFFKFSLIDALSQSDIFMAIIDYVLQLIDLFNKLSPEAKQSIGVAIGLFAVLGTTMFIAGQIMTFLSSIVMVFGPITSASVGLAIAALAIFLVDIAVLILLWDYVIAGLKRIFAWAKFVFNAVVDSVKIMYERVAAYVAIMFDIFQIAFNGIKFVIGHVVNFFLEKWETAFNLLSEWLDDLFGKLARISILGKKPFEALADLSLGKVSLGTIDTEEAATQFWSSVDALKTDLVDFAFLIGDTPRELQNKISGNFLTFIDDWNDATVKKEEEKDITDQATQENIERNTDKSAMTMEEMLEEMRKLNTTLEDTKSVYGSPQGG